MSGFLSRFSIGTRIVATSALVLVLMGLMTFVSVREIDGVNADLGQINEVNSVLQRYAINFRGSAHDQAIAVRDVVILDDPAGRRAAVAEIDRLQAFYLANERSMEQLVARVNATEHERQMLADIDRIETRTTPLVADIIRMREAGDAAGARALLVSEVSGLFTDWLAAINRFIDYQEAENQRIGAAVSASAAGFRMLALTSFLIAAAIAGLVGLLVVRSISRPLGAIVAVMSDLSRGRRDVEVAGTDRRDEIGDIARAVEVFRRNEVERVRLQARARSDADHQLLRTRELEGLTKRFRDGMTRVLGALADETGVMSRAAGTLSDANVHASGEA